MTAIARILSALGALLWLGAVVLLGAWAFGRVVTDRWVWSQYLFWIPSLLVLPAGAAALAAAMGLRAGSRRIVGRPWAGSRLERRWVCVSAGALAAAAAWVVTVEYRWLSPSPAASTSPFRVLHWNATDRIGDTWDLSLSDQKPDLLVINPASNQPWDRLLERCPHIGQPLWRFGFTVLSRYRTLRTGYTSLGIEPGLGIDPREPEHMVRRSDHGRAMFLELDTRAALGRTLIVWCLDLPSDVSLSRRQVTEQAARAIADFPGPVDVLGDDGVYVRETPRVKGFPPPDLILGDMNIPRGSLSLTRLTGGCSAVFDQAGRGPFGTWPYARPLFHLDQMFIAPWLRAEDYRVIDLGGGTHRAQRADLSARDRGGSPGTLPP